ncbi:hypothetical protein GYMLUDRAFT_173276, partial [Collybiopsis luxurians FD-317 M1]
IPCNVTTRWNSTHNMLVSFVKMKDIILDFLDCSLNSLVEFVLMKDGWEAIEGLVMILKDAMLFFSADSPLVASVIPAMDAIDEAFATGIINDKELSTPIQNDLMIAKKTLNKYYSLIDNSIIPRLAMSKYKFLCCLKLFSADSLF